MKANLRNRRNAVKISRGNRQGSFQTQETPAGVIDPGYTGSSNGSTRGNSKGTRRTRRSSGSSSRRQWGLYPQDTQGFPQGFYPQGMPQTFPQGFTGYPQGLPQGFTPGYTPTPGFFPEQQFYTGTPTPTTGTGYTTSLPTTGYTSMPWATLSHLWSTGNAQTRTLLCSLYPTVFTPTTSFGSGCFAIGDTLQITPTSRSNSGNTGKTYTMIIASVGRNKITLVDLERGTRWGNTTQVQDVHNITPEEMCTLVGQANYPTIQLVSGVQLS